MSGNTNIVGGILEVGNGGATGNLGTGGIVNNAALVFNRDTTTNLTVASVISGTGTVTKRGTGTVILTGTNTYSGNTSVETGTLSLTGPNFHTDSTIRIASAGTLNLNYTGTDTVNVLFIGGVPQIAGTWGSMSSTATNKTSFITGNGILNVATTGSDPYGTWAISKGLDDSNKAANLNPDGDRLNNLGEFAFDGDPLGSKTEGKIVTKMVDIDGKKVLTLTLPVRDSTIFNTPGPGTTTMFSTPKDGIVYTIEGTATLSGYPLQITEIIPAITADVVTPTAGWTLRTFRTPGTPTAGNPNTTPKEFLRARVTEQP